jgi:hypothetical protein
LSLVKKVAFILAFAASLYAADSSAAKADSSAGLRTPDSVGTYIAVPDSVLEFDRQMQRPMLYNPIVAGGLSALLPGAGQVYCSGKERASRKWAKRIKGGLFLAANGIAAGVVANRVLAYKAYCSVLDDTAKVRSGSLRAANTAINSTARADALDSYYRLTMDYEMVRYERRARRYTMYQAIGWNTGLYLFNIMSAVGGSGYFYSDERRNPVAAAWLSAVPALGLGQLYNGSISKAGMIWMVQTMLLNMAYNYNRLMTDCIEQQNMLADSTNWRHRYKETGAVDYEENWEGKYDDAFTQRNLYLWYAIFFYLYGIFDAAVDAHLHDYQLKIRMGPAANLKREQFGLCFHVDL